MRHVLSRIASLQLADVSALVYASLWMLISKLLLSMLMYHNYAVLSQLRGADAATSKTTRGSSPKTGSRLQARAAAAHAQDDR
jgi:hypothetical protein